jgi:hypothetical protein
MGTSEPGSRCDGHAVEKVPAGDRAVEAESTVILECHGEYL